MSSVVDMTSSATSASAFHQLTPGAAALMPNPLAHRMRIRHRLGLHVYLAEATASCGANSSQRSTTISPPRRVVKIGRLRRPWEAPQDVRSFSVSAFQELRVARLLLAEGEGHANVVHPLEIHEQGRLSFLVMEFCDGGDLFSFVTRSATGRLEPHDALRKLHQVASGVQFLHSRNIAHRDLSLENILIHDGVCKICDFGLSTRADARARGVVGKTAYAAPEVVQGGWYDPVRADLWSLGIVLFMMLTGSSLVPFASPSCAEFRAFRVVGVRGVLRAWGLETQFSAATVDLLARLLETRPENRVASAEELLAHPAMLAAASAPRGARMLTQL